MAPNQIQQIPWEAIRAFLVNGKGQALGSFQPPDTELAEVLAVLEAGLDAKHIAAGSEVINGTITDGAVTLAKMANMATASVIYRKTAGAGVPQVQTLATLKADLLPPGAHIADAAVTVEDVIAKFNTLLARLEALGLLASS
jgi:hypothetical protein